MKEIVIFGIIFMFILAPSFSLVTINLVSPVDLGQTINTTSEFTFIPISQITRTNSTILGINSTQNGTHKVNIGNARTDVDSILIVNISTPSTDSASVNISVNGNLLANVFVTNGSTKTFEFTNVSIIPNTINNVTYTSNTSNLINITQTSITYHQSTFSCTLFIDNVPFGTNSSVKDNTSTTIISNSTISNGDHFWYVNCTDEGGIYKSSNRIIGIGQYFDRCAVLLDNTTFYLNNNISSSVEKCIQFKSNGTTLDCQYNNITHPLPYSQSLIYGIAINKKSNETIKNCNVKKFSVGILINESSGIRIYNVSLLSNYHFTGLMNAPNGKGIYLLNCFNNLLKNVSSLGNDIALYSSSSFNNTIKNLTSISDCNNMYAIGSIILSSSNNNKFINININNSGASGIVIQDNSNDNLIENSKFYHNGFTATLGSAGVGISLNGVSNNTIKKSIISRNFIMGIYIYKGQNTTINDSKIEYNGASYPEKGSGIFLKQTSANSIVNSQINFNRFGIYSLSSSNNKIENDNFTNDGAQGVYFNGEENTTISNAVIAQCGYGIYLDSAKNNTIKNSTLLNNSYFNVFIKANSNDYCNNSIENSNNTNNLPILLYNHKINLNNKKVGSLILCNADNSSIKNVSIESSLLVIRTNNSSFTNITSSNSYIGIFLDSSDYDTFLSNKIKNNFKCGLKISNSNYTKIINNTFETNRRDICEINLNHTNYTSNKFLFNHNSSFVNLLTNNTQSPFTVLPFNISITFPNESADNISFVSIHGISFKHYNSTIYGNISLSRIGLYAILLNFTDTNGNRIIQPVYFFSTNNSYNNLWIKKVKYYLRPDVLPTHGQPAGVDSRALTFSKPNIAKTFSCYTWIQASPDVAPLFKIGIIKNISMIYWYRAYTFSKNPEVGIQKKVTYGSSMDVSKTISNSQNEYSLGITKFINLNWSMTNDNDWYNLSFKLTGSPYWLSSPINLSYVNITYESRAPPALISYSPSTDLTYLSSTLSDDLSSSETIIEGKGIHTFQFKMPLKGSYYVLFDGNLCNNLECNYTTNGEFVNVTTSLGSIHNITIVKATSPSQIKFSCSPTNVFLGEKIECSCKVTNTTNYKKILYNKNPDTSRTGTFTTTCNVIDLAGNVISKSLQYIVHPWLFIGGNIQPTQWTYTFGIINNSVCMEPNNENLSFKEICVSLIKPQKDVKVTIKIVNGSNLNFNSSAYQYIKISTNLNESLIKVSKIKFMVDKNWINSKGLNERNISLFRLTNGKWNKLNTTIVKSSNNKYIYYVANSPGLSYFVIGLIKPHPNVIQTNNTTKTKSINQTMIRNESPQSKINVINLIYLINTIIAITLIWIFLHLRYFHRKRRKR